MTKPITYNCNFYYRIRHITILLLLFFFTNTVKAQPSFCISNATGTSSITVDVTVADFDNLMSIQFPIEWDNNILEFDSVSNLSLLDLNTQNNLVHLTSQPNVLKFLWFDPDNNGVSLPDGSIIFSITFKVLSNGFSPIEIKENSPVSIPPFMFEVTQADGTVYFFPDIITKSGSVNGLVAMISGNLFNDENLDCSLSTDENGLANWILKIEDDNFTYYTITDENGDYDILLDTGSYEITPQVPNSYWQSCQSSYSVNLDGANSVIENIAIQPIVSCPLMSIDLSTPFLRRCFENKYTIHYCNQGTTIAPNASVEIT